MNGDLDDFDDLNSVNVFALAKSFDLFQEDAIRDLRSIRAPIPSEVVGSSCDLKEFDSVYNAEGNRVQLKSGSSVRPRHPDPTSSKSALVRIRYWSRNGDEERCVLEVRSSHMKAALNPLLPQHRRVNIDTEHITLPYAGRCLFHYQEGLFKYGQQLSVPPEAEEHVIFLLKYFLKEFSQDVVAYSSSIDAAPRRPSLDFSRLWMLFKPGELVHVSIPGWTSSAPELFEFTDMKLTCGCQEWACVLTHEWILTGFIVSRNATHVGYVASKEARLKYYDGCRDAADLPIAPLRFRSDSVAIRNRCFVHGTKFIRLRQGCQYRQYKGKAWALEDSRHPEALGSETRPPLVPAWISSRIIIDAETFYQTRPAYDDLVFQPSHEILTISEFQERALLPKDMSLLCATVIPGYAINERKWAYFEIDLVEYIHFTAAFTRDLVLDDARKELILSLVETNYVNWRPHSHSVVRGKDKGAVILFHGDPGVGKTLAAESVADHLRIPLVTLDVRAMSGKPSEVEAAVSSTLQLAEKWNAVALIDEADVLFEQRSPSDLARNGLVSDIRAGAVFLRILDGYRGIIILTTNRVSVLDRAFESRIHLAIHFPRLNVQSRRSLWLRVLERLVLHPETAAEISVLVNEVAAKELNGRQIRNAAQLALSLNLRSNHGRDTLADSSRDNSEGPGLLGKYIRDAVVATTASQVDLEKSRFPSSEAAGDVESPERQECLDIQTVEGLLRRHGSDGLSRLVRKLGPRRGSNTGGTKRRRDEE